MGKVEEEEEGDVEDRPDWFVSAVEHVEEAFETYEMFYDITIDEPVYRETGFKESVNPYSTPQELSLSWAVERGRNLPFAGNRLEDYRRGNIRSIVYHQAVQDVAEQYPAELETYYEEELSHLDLTVSTDPIIGLINNVRNRLVTDDPRPHDDLYANMLKDMESQDVATVVMGKNDTTDSQIDCYTRKGTHVIKTGMYGGIGSILGSNAARRAIQGFNEHGFDILQEDPRLMRSAMFSGVFLYLAYQSLSHLRQDDGLSDELLEPYPPQDRKRLLLYNTTVADSPEEFLPVLDEYGIT